MWTKADTPPETAEWVIGMTQDGTLYPVTYDGKKWSPVFRGGYVDSLMHGRIAYWHPVPAGYQIVTCERGHSYLGAPEVEVCPVCESFGFVKKQTEETAQSDQPRLRGRKPKKPE